MNPLKKILEWFDNQEEDIKRELVSISAHFHFDSEIEIIIDYKAKIERFRDYMNSSILKDIEIVQRSLFIIKLFDFSMTGRENELEWTEVMDRHLEMRSRFIEKGHSTEVTDNFLDSFEDRKNTWIALCSDWHDLTNNELSNKKIADWYFFRMIDNK